MLKRHGYLLIVEDVPDIQKLLETTLTFNGYRVLTANNGEEGLEAIRKERPAIVITDIMMPRLDGFGLVQRLRISPEMRDIPVIFITATYVTRDDREFALKIGATRFIQKPVDLEEFLKTIGELLSETKPVMVEPLSELYFYEGYQKRLDAKLSQKALQISRDELLLKSTYSDEERQRIQASLRQAISERDELAHLLEQVNEQLSKIANIQ
jgi:DNA-binding response OmpR family regulator